MPAPASVRFLSLSMGDAAKGAQILVLYQGEGRGARATKRGYFERGLLSVDPSRLFPPLSAAAAAAAFLRASYVLTCGVGGKKEGMDGNDAWEEGKAPAPAKAEDKKQDLPHVGISSSLPLLLFFPIMNTVLN